MRLIKVAQHIYKRFLSPEQIKELEEIEIDLDIWSNKFVDHYSRSDAGDPAWVNEKDRIRKRMNELSSLKDEIVRPAIDQLRREREVSDKEEKRRRNKEQEILEMAKNDTSFQILIDNKIKDWPTTEDPRLAGYIMFDGRMLYMSYSGFMRDMDHREITQEIDELSGETIGMEQFMYATGAVRMHAPDNHYVGFNWLTEPSRSQKKRILEVAEGRDSINVDADGQVYEFDSYWEMQEEFGWF